MDIRVGRLASDSDRAALFNSSGLLISFQEATALEKLRHELSCRYFPRQQLSSLLSAYNHQINNDQAAFSQIEELKKNNSVCVITGQQLGVMGGAAYTVLKGISCLIAAKRLGAVPIFWLATEDHDVGEIDHTYFIDSLGNLKKWHLALSKDGFSVEDLLLSEKNQELVREWLTLIPNLRGILPGSSYALTMARVLARLFQGTGLVFLEPRLLRPLAAPFFVKEIAAAQEIHRVLSQTAADLANRGEKPILSFNEGINLFFKDDRGLRKKIIPEGRDFIVGEHRYSEKEILHKAENQPERFSPNAAARPLLQSSLLPALAYLAGPTEKIYYSHLRDYHLWHGIPMPLVLPRLSATFIPPYAASIFEKCGLHPDEKVPAHWIDILPTLEGRLKSIRHEWLHTLLNYCGEEIPDRDAARYVRLCTRVLQKKLFRNYLKRHHIPSNGLHLLHHLIHPRNQLQERVLNWCALQQQSQGNLVEQCLKISSWNPAEHYYLYT